MKIKPKYTDPETTPIKFLKFIRIVLWIGLFLNIGNIMLAISPEINWYGLIVYVVLEVLYLFAISGLNRMEWSGVKAYWGIYWLQVGEGLLAAGLSVYYGSAEDVSRALGQSVAGVIILFLTWIYFQKRRLLFTPIPEQYLPLMEKEKEQIQELIQKEKVEPAAQPQSVKDGENQSESCFCRNCGNLLPRGSNFCNLCGKAVSSTVLEEPKRKKGKGRLGLVLALSAAALVAGVFLLREDSVQRMPPAQAAESVLYLEVYNKKDEYIGSGSGFLVNDRTTLVTNYHVMENAGYLLVVRQNNEVAAVADTVLAYDVDLDLAVLRCDREVEAQPLILGNSGAVKQGDKIYAAGYPLGIANTLSDGIVSSMYVDEFGAEVLQITAPVSEGSSGGALLNENGQVVGVVSATYTEGQNMNLAISVNQLRSLLEQEEENGVLLKTIMEGDGKHFRKSRKGFVYCEIPSVLSLENVFEESDEIYFMKALPLQEGQMYSYMTTSQEAYRCYVRKYIELLNENGYTEYAGCGMITPDGEYWISIYDGYGITGESEYPILVRVTKFD